ncbi:MAG: transposase [Holosporaceae bacterium]|nr:transposase [Holosporaceae bacterium]
MAYSIEFRREVLASANRCEDGIRGAARKFRISPTTVLNWKKLFEETGSLEIRHTDTKERKINQDEFKRTIEEKPDMLQRELGDNFNFCCKSVWKMLNNFGYKYKKKRLYVKGMKKSAKNTFRQ